MWQAFKEYRGTAACTVFQELKHKVKAVFILLAILPQKKGIYMVGQ